MSRSATGIRYLDGQRLRRAFIAGARFVTDRAEPLNRINVFPVPDGDTGTNMAMTLSSIARGAVGSTERHARQAAVSIADEAVSGARGNSGAILAQFLTGFSEAVPDRPRIGTEEFGNAVVRGAESAHSAIARPQEGTILTVLRDWAQHVSERASQVGDFGRLLADGLAAAKESLAHTPEKLAVLKKSGVVDAGAQGFVYLLEGIVAYVRDAARRSIPAPPEETRAAKFDRTSDTFLFRYCTEALIEGSGIDRNAIRRNISLLGDSLVVAGSSERMRVHVHTNEPETVFRELAADATVVQTKVEDMRLQHAQTFDRAREKRVGLVIDSACDLPQTLLDEHEVQVVPLRVHFGLENYLDRVTIQPAEFYARFAVCSEFPKTSQPPFADFRQIYESLAVHHGTIVSIHVSSALSGTYQAAVAAARGIPATEVVHVDSRSASIALGLIVRVAAEALRRGASAAEAAEAARSASSRVRFFISVPNITHLVRGGRVSAGKGRLARILGLLPVLTIAPDGRAAAAGAAFGHNAAIRTMMKRLFAAAGGGSGEGRLFGIVHADALEGAERLAAQIRNRYPRSDVMIQEASPVLGAHAGPGALGVAVLPPA